MIPKNYVQRWGDVHAWQNLMQVEQDLIISRALVDLFKSNTVKETLVFRGGTALNKLFLIPAARYSEDIDFVQIKPGPIGEVINAIREVLSPWLGDPKWKITKRGAKLIFKYEAIDQQPSKLKIEINTTEHIQKLPLKSMNFTVDSDWYNGAVDVITYEINELMATKLRALYQRRKGRDMFDIWYVANQDLIDLDKVIELFYFYCGNEGISISHDEFLHNLELKKLNKDFRMDMSKLLPPSKSWDFDKAYHYVVDNVISRLPS